MGKGTPVSKAEEADILAALETGLSLRQVGRDFDRSNSTIADVAKRNGFDVVEHARRKRADTARTCYDSTARIELVGKLLKKAEELMKTCESPRDLQYLATAMAIGIDKRRLEEGPGKGEKSGEIKALFERMEEDEEADNTAAGDIENEQS